MKVYIYALADPDDFTVKYVGMTKNIKKRYAQHLKKLDKTDTPKRRWLERLFEQGKKPLLQLLEISDEQNGRNREAFYFEKHKDTCLNIHNPKKGAKSRKLKDINL